MFTHLCLIHLAWIDESSDSVKELFVAHGAVSDVYMPTNRETGKGRGFCFVTMSNPEDAQKAIAALDNTTIGGRPVFVNLAGTEAKPRKKSKLHMVEYNCSTTPWCAFD